jgi:hypothetical protein
MSAAEQYEAVSVAEYLAASVFHSIDLTCPLREIYEGVL